MTRQDTQNKHSQSCCVVAVSEKLRYKMSSLEWEDIGIKGDLFAKTKKQPRNQIKS